MDSGLALCLGLLGAFFPLILLGLYIQFTHISKPNLSSIPSFSSVLKRVEERGYQKLFHLNPDPSEQSLVCAIQISKHLFLNYRKRNIGSSCVEEVVVEDRSRKPYRARRGIFLNDRYNSVELCNEKGESTTSEMKFNSEGSSAYMLLVLMRGAAGVS